MSDTPNYAEKIALLLAKAEGTDNPIEAQAYSEKAERLMIKWGLDDATVAAARGHKGPTDKIIERRYDIKGTYHVGEVEIGNAIARVLGLRPLMAKSRHEMRTTLYVIGFESDAQRFDVLFTSLRMQAQSALAAWTKDQKLSIDWSVMTHHEKFKARRQFLMSFGWEVGRRLDGMTKQAVAESGTGTEIALRDRSDLVDEDVARRYPKVRHTRGVGFNPMGSTAGRAAGARANIGQNGLAGERRAIR